MIFIILFTVFSQVFAKVKIGSFPISVNFKPLEEGSTLIDRDRARFRVLYTRHEKRAGGIRLKNTGLGYTLSIGFGSPPTYYDLMLDTGSAYTWIGAGKEYIKTKTSIKQEGQSFEIQYLTGWVAGEHYKDLVTVSPLLSIPNMPFGVATSYTESFAEEFDGILGLGRTKGNEGRVMLDNGEPVPNIMDTLLAQNKIQRNVFGLSFAPANYAGIENGRLTLGETDTRHYTGELQWVGIMNEEPLNRYWSYEQAIKYGNKVIQRSSAGYIDSGTVLVYITPQAFEAYSKSIPGSKIDHSTGMLEIPQASLSKMKSMFFVINRVSYEFTPNAQLWPHKFNTLIRGKSGAYYSVICSLNGLGDDVEGNFMSGYTFMQRFYTAYDASTSKIGFATTSSTFADVN